MIPWTYRPASDFELDEADRWPSLHRESGLVSSLLHQAWWTAAGSFLAFWNRLHVFGRNNIPVEPPFVLVANHSSHLDALVLGSILPTFLRDRVFPIAAGDVFFDASWKAVLAAKLLNALPLWRRHCGVQALRQLRRRLLHDPCGYVLFPEGCRSRDGRMLPFKTGVGMLVAESKVPVVPCHLSGCHAALPPGKTLPRRSPITVRVGQPMTFERVENSRTGWNRIASHLRSAIEELSKHPVSAAKRQFVGGR